MCSTDNVKYTMRLNARGTTHVGRWQVYGAVLIMGRVSKPTQQWRFHRLPLIDFCSPQLYSAFLWDNLRKHAGISSLAEEDRIKKQSVMQSIHLAECN